MILADTSVWVDHLRHRDGVLEGALLGGEILMHPAVLGEIALGNLRSRANLIKALSELPRVTIAQDIEVLTFIEQNRLFGCGIGFVDAHLLASTQLTTSAKLWTRDKRLSSISHRLGLQSDLA